MNKKYFASTVDNLHDLPNAAPLLDYLIARYELKNDRALGRMLEMEASQISKLRSGQIGVTPGTILRIHDTTGLSVAEIRALARGE